MGIALLSYKVKLEFRMTSMLTETEKKDWIYSILRRQILQNGSEKRHAKDQKLKA